MTISGSAARTAVASASASNTSTMTGQAPSPRTNSILSGERVVPQTEWPAWRRRGASRRPITPAAPARKIRLTGLCPPWRREPSGAQIFVEPIDRPLPGFLCRGLIVARRRVVVEAVVGALIDMALVRNARRVKSGVERRPAAGDAPIELAILGVERGLDLCRVGGVRLQAVERHGGVETGT